MYSNSLILGVEEDRFVHEPYETKYLESNFQPDPSASSQPFCLLFCAVQEAVYVCILKSVPTL